MDPSTLMSASSRGILDGPADGRLRGEVHHRVGRLAPEDVAQRGAADVRHVEPRGRR